MGLWKTRMLAQNRQPKSLSKETIRFEFSFEVSLVSIWCPSMEKSSKCKRSSKKIAFVCELLRLLQILLHRLAGRSTTLWHSRLYPPERDYELGYWDVQSNNLSLKLIKRMSPNVGFYIWLSKDLLRLYRSVVFSHHVYVYLTWGPVTWCWPKAAPLYSYTIIGT